MGFSTEDCQQFLANVWKNNQAFMQEAFSDSLVGWLLQLSVLTNPVNWKRISKFSPTTETDDYVPSYNDDRLVFNDHYEWAGYTDIRNGIVLPLETIVNVRMFSNTVYDGGMRFLVFETRDRLYLGKYVGD